MVVIDGETHIPIDIVLRIMEQHIWRTKGVRVNINRPDTPERIKIFERALKAGL